MYRQETSGARHPYCVTLFASPMGHDVGRVAEILTGWLEKTGLFRTRIVGVCPQAEEGIHDFMQNRKEVKRQDLFIFECPDDEWKDPEDRRLLEETVAEGTPILFCHGLHPCFRDWPEMEKMIGLLWRQTAFHGDFNTCPVHIQAHEHPITRGVEDFQTEDELFCRLENVWNVPMEVLATAWSDPERESRWGFKGSGMEEPILTTGTYGKARTVDFLLGHIWPFYTGHGLMETTAIAYEPPQVKTLFLRSCEWAITGEVKDVLRWEGREAK